jgi:SAM-dependent methyltransferase
MRQPYPSLGGKGGQSPPRPPTAPVTTFSPEGDIPDDTPDDSAADLGFAGYRPAGGEESVRGNRAWWDANAAGYRSEHGADLAGRLVWGPEGLDEADAHLLGDVAGARVLEIGAGSGDCSDWLRGQGAQVVASDLSIGMLTTGSPVAGRDGGGPGGRGRAPRVVADGRRLPFADTTFDIAFSAYGAIPFVADPERLLAEVHRVLAPGGRWVFSVTHPIRWAFPDDPGTGGLRVRRSYFDRTPYVEAAPDGSLAYAEHHRTLGDRVRELVGAGFGLVDLIEPEWPPGLTRNWGSWSPLRGRLIPGTAIFVTRRTGDPG